MLRGKQGCQNLVKVHREIEATESAIRRSTDKGRKSHRVTRSDGRRLQGTETAVSSTVPSARQLENRE